MYLEKIRGPEDLRNLSPSELKSLAAEIRSIIVAVVSKTGGHLASSLGVVDLTIALHAVFNTPTDTIVWDVGHQCYAHKILTGRLDRFPTLRQYKGLSGFISPDESPYDSFFVGHAGTATSLMDGVISARKILGRKEKVIAVVGDASFSTGMSFEAINHIGHHQTPCILILNDNEMSISKNVGALARYFNKLITQPFYNKFKFRASRWLRSIPIIGKPLRRVIDRVQEFLKAVIVPGIIFEELGFRYIGPIDGHDIGTLIDTFRKTAFMEDRPLLIHVVTRKGKGLPEAENNPEFYHGVPKPCKPSLTYTGVFSRTLLTLAAKDPKITAITAAMKEGTGLAEFANRFPDRFFDVGIAEQHAVTFAAGLASEGLKPFVALYSTFLQRAFDQIIHDAALPRLPVRLCIDRAGIVGDDGPTHNGQFDLSFLSMIPHIVLLAPADENEFQHLLAGMALYDKGPIAIRYPRGAGTGVPLDPEPVACDIFRHVVLRRGPDALLLAAGSAVPICVDACAMLEADGISVTLVNCRCLKPLDEEVLLPLLRTAPAVLTVEENVIRGGFGSSIAELTACRKIRVPVFDHMGLPDAFLETGTPAVLREQVGLTPGMIRDRALILLEKKTAPAGNGCIHAQ